MTYKFPVGTYSITLASERSGPVDNGAAFVTCWSPDLKLMAEIHFREGPTLPKNSVSTTPTRVSIVINLLATRYGWCVDLLRNERPIAISYFEETDRFYLSTSERQPVGEGVGLLADGGAHG
jgi:hypothetical protein